MPKELLQGNISLEDDVSKPPLQIEVTTKTGLCQNNEVTVHFAVTASGKLSNCRFVFKHDENNYTAIKGANMERNFKAGVYQFAIEAEDQDGRTAERNLILTVR